MLVSNDGVTRIQIEHILIDPKHGRYIIDVRRLLKDSDHFLVEAKVHTRVFCQKCVRSECREKRISRDYNKLNTKRGKYR